MPPIIIYAIFKRTKSTQTHFNVLLSIQIQQQNSQAERELLSLEVQDKDALVHGIDGVKSNRKQNHESTFSILPNCEQITPDNFSKTCLFHFTTDPRLFRHKCPLYIYFKWFVTNQAQGCRWWRKSPSYAGSGAPCNAHSPWPRWGRVSSTSPRSSVDGCCRTRQPGSNSRPLLCH